MCQGRTRLTRTDTRLQRFGREDGAANTWPRRSDLPCCHSGRMRRIMGACGRDVCANRRQNDPETLIENACVPSGPPFCLRSSVRLTMPVERAGASALSGSAA